MQLEGEGERERRDETSFETPPRWSTLLMIVMKLEFNHNEGVNNDPWPLSFKSKRRLNGKLCRLKKENKITFCECWWYWLRGGVLVELIFSDSLKNGRAIRLSGWGATYLCSIGGYLDYGARQIDMVSGQWNGYLDLRGFLGMSKFNGSDVFDKSNLHEDKIDSDSRSRRIEMKRTDLKWDGRLKVKVFGKWLICFVVSAIGRPWTNLNSKESFVAEDVVEYV